jgi:hypothetical protein
MVAVLLGALAFPAQASQATRPPEPALAGDLGDDARPPRPGPTVPGT